MSPITGTTVAMMNQMKKELPLILPMIPPARPKLSAMTT
jgi:hypothetical protein